MNLIVFWYMINKKMISTFESKNIQTLKLNISGVARNFWVVGNLPPEPFLGVGSCGQFPLSPKNSWAITFAALISSHHFKKSMGNNFSSSGQLSNGSWLDTLLLNIIQFNSHQYVAFFLSYFRLLDSFEKLDCER